MINNLFRKQSDIFKLSDLLQDREDRHDKEEGEETNAIKEAE